MKALLFQAVVCALLFPARVSAQAGDTICRYVAVPNGYLMVLRQGDSLFGEVQELVVSEGIAAASITGMGFAEVELGFFRPAKRDYKSKKLQPGELASMHGSIAWKDGSPSIHIHGVIGNKRFRTRGGHILSAKVGMGSLEIMVTVHDKKLERKRDERLGADVLYLGNCGM